jgi:hypothetical protein
MTNDPFDSAENPQLRSAEFWGQVQIDTFYAVLVKGTGKIPFDPQQHSIDKRVTAIDIQIFPIPEQNNTYEVKRNMIAESKEWAGMVLPSIKALGISARELNNRWVHVTAVPTGGTYTNKSGETKDRTTFKFVKLFASEAECKADFLSDFGSATASPATPAPAQVTPDGNAVDLKEKATAVQFLKVLVKKAEGDPAKLTPMLAQFPMVNKYFTVDSTETVSAMLDYLSKAA